MSNIPYGTPKILKFVVHVLEVSKLKSLYTLSQLLKLSHYTLDSTIEAHSIFATWPWASGTSAQETLSSNIEFWFG